MKLIFILGLLVAIVGALPLIGYMPDMLTQGNNYQYAITGLGLLIAVIAWMLPGGESIREQIRSKI